MDGIRGHISIREASYRWGVSERRVNQYCYPRRVPVRTLMCDPGGCEKAV